MTTPRTRKGKNHLDPTQIARAVFAAAESVGLADRQMMEQLTQQVIQRLELPQPLPGMESLVSSTIPGSKPPPSQAEIQTVVKEVLASKGIAESVPPSGIRLTDASPTMPETGYHSSQAEVHTAVKDTLAEKITAERVPPSGIRLTENARRVLEKRYLAKDSQGRVVETPEDMFRRVARHVAQAELIYDPEADVAHMEEEFYQLMTNLEFLPNSPTLMNAGRELGQLSACFVLPVEDSMESIFDAVKYTALIHKSGGGTGFSFSRLRPEKDRVGSTGGVASGPVSFMRAFDAATDVIKQGGMRRGANMAILNVDHPDIEKFITAKEDTEALTNFNLSVAITAKFMKAVEEGADYELINPHTGEAVGNLNAKEVFDKIVDMAWRTGDPGIVFIDRINEHNPTPKLGRIESTNPCGEQPLLPFESCNLGSINLSRMLRERDGAFEIDNQKLADTVRVVVRFLDNVIDVNQFPLPQIAESTQATRKIGLGVMGFADMLIKQGIAYDSEKALEVAEYTMACISKEATEASKELAKERNVFPAFPGSVYDKPKEDGGIKVRNATRTTIAPTGTLSIIAGCSSGIEPLFALSYMRHILDGEQLVEVNPYFEEVARREGFYSTELMRKLAEGAKLHDVEGVPGWVKKVFVTAHDITPEGHVKMQAAFQKSTHNAVSKTVNFPHHATREDVARVYRLAYQEGVKGVTIYRDRSRESQVLTIAQREEAEDERISPRKRPKVTTGVTERMTTGCGYIYVTINFDNRGICEVFSSLGKAGGCASAQLEAASRLISLALRSGVDLASVVKHLRGIRCPSIAWEGGHAVLSCADAIGSVLEKYIKDEDGGEGAEDYGLVKNWAGQCPDCGSMLVYQEGCHICPSCGYTKCS